MVCSDRFALLRERLALPDEVSDELLEQALRHSSYVREHALDEHASNQRLEFLGDAVLDLIFADLLYRTHPQHTEGELTRLKAELVRKRALASIATSVGLGEFLLLGRGEDSTGGREKASLLADAVEALIGAVFLAVGWDAARDMVLTNFRPLLAEAEGRDTLRDSKSRLQELLQSSGAPPPQYCVAKTDGPPHERRFCVEAKFDDQIIGVGDGPSKREAEQAAAAEALENVDDWLEQ